LEVESNFMPKCCVIAPPSTPTRATGPSTQETVPHLLMPIGPVVTLSRPVDQAAFAILASQVQKLSANQASSQQQLQDMDASQQAVQQQMQALLAHLQPQRLPQPHHYTATQPPDEPSPHATSSAPHTPEAGSTPLECQGAQLAPQIPLSIE